MRGNLKGTQGRHHHSTTSRFVRCMAVSVVSLILCLLTALMVMNIHIGEEGDHLDILNFNAAVKYANRFVHNHSLPHIYSLHRSHHYNAHLLHGAHSSGGAAVPGFHPPTAAVASSAATTAAPEVKPKIAFLFAGSVRSFVCPKVHWSIKTNLLDSIGGEPYTFIRISAEDNRNIKTGTGTLWKPPYDKNEVQETLKVLHPRTVTWFSFSEQEKEMKSNFPSDIHRVFRENDQRRYSMFFHRCMAYRMVLDYEAQHKMRFDWVVLARLDAAWLDPILPIDAYANDRVWLTETGYDRFNDQFMLIPRQFSDYIYDLNTKVVKGVYCLGGPDVERWKCNATELNNRGYQPDKAKSILDNCCPDTSTPGAGGQINTIGRSERIHYRHLREGKIPIGIGRFPVFLTRRTEWKECHPECFRIYAYHYKEYVYRFTTAIYKYLMPPLWPDTRGRSISARDRALCYYMGKESSYPWQPPTAASIHLLTPGLGEMQSYSADVRQYAQSLGRGNESFIDLSKKHNQHISYNNRLIDQREYLHPSLLVNPKYLEVWRIHPTWNIEGCLTFNFATKSAMWEMCKGHSKLKSIRYDPRQLFFLNVIPSRNIGTEMNIPGFHIANQFPQSTYSSDVSNFTRVMAINSDMKTYDHRSQMHCLTATSIQLHAAVDFKPCNPIDSMHPSQLFLTVRGVSDGSHPATTVGQLAIAANPKLCLARPDNNMKEFNVFPDGNKLFLFHCTWGAHAHRNSYEFELITS